MSIASRGATMAVDWEQRINVLTRFPAEELLVTGKVYVRGADMIEWEGRASRGAAGVRALGRAPRVRQKPEIAMV